MIVIFVTKRLKRSDQGKVQQPFMHESRFNIV